MLQDSITIIEDSLKVNLFKMEEHLITYETAKLAKGKGFDIPCVNFWYREKMTQNPYCGSGVEYDSDRDCIWNWNHSSPYPNKHYKYQFSAPTQSILQKWLREKHGLNLFITEGTIHQTKYKFYINQHHHKSPEYDTYEDALECGLVKALKLIKN